MFWDMLDVFLTGVGIAGIASYPLWCFFLLMKNEKRVQFSRKVMQVDTKGKHHFVTWQPIPIASLTKIAMLEIN